MYEGFLFTGMPSGDTKNPAAISQHCTNPCDRFEFWRVVHFRMWRLNLTSKAHCYRNRNYHSLELILAPSNGTEDRLCKYKQKHWFQESKRRAPFALCRTVCDRGLESIITNVVVGNRTPFRRRVIVNDVRRSHIGGERNGNTMKWTFRIQCTLLSLVKRSHRDK